jgi:esterase/lipase superfamily enzyme
MTSKRVRNYLKRQDDKPLSYSSTLSHVVNRIRKASQEGVGIRLSAEEIRALDWCVIRELGGVENTDQFREGSFKDIGEV